MHACFAYIIMEVALTYSCDIAIGAAIILTYVYLHNCWSNFHFQIPVSLVHVVILLSVSGKEDLGPLTTHAYLTAQVLCKLAFNDNVIIGLHG